MHNLRQWPEEWEDHLIQASSLYFYDRPIIYVSHFLSTSCWIDSYGGNHVETYFLGLILEIGRTFYTCEVLFNKGKILLRIFASGQEVSGIQFVGGEGTTDCFYALTAFDCLQKIEQDIIDDYYRGGDNGDDGGGDDEPEIFPFDPIDSEMPTFTPACV